MITSRQTIPCIQSPQPLKRRHFREVEIPMSTQDDALEREFDVVMAKAGISVPPQRRAGLLVSYKDMQRMAALLRQPRTAASEPSNIFSLKPFLRKS